MAIDVSFRDTITFNTTAKDVSRLPQKFIINQGTALGGLRVTQSDTPAMSVKVEPGTGYFYGSGSNANVMYEFESDANETVSIGASGVQARIDIICLKVDSATEVASIVAIAGTPSGSPAVPATPASHYKLAEVAVGISVTTITNANITDTRRSVFVAPTGARNQGLINGKIVPTVASNNLTVAIKTLSDTDPSATNPVGIWIGNELRWITGALSTTMPAGFNAFNSGSAEHATREQDYFAFVGVSNTNNLCFGFTKFNHYRLGSQLADSVTSQYYGRFTDTTATVLTNTTQVTNIVNVGRFAATLSAGAGFTWTVPTYTNENLRQEPTYRTRLFTYSTQFTANGGGSFTPNIRIQTYEIIENKVFVQWETNAHTISGTVTSIDFSLPFTSADEVSNGFQFGVLGFSLASGQVIKGETQGAGTLIRFAPTSGNWAATAGAGYLGIKDVYTI
jgi:hypothetical protein